MSSQSTKAGFSRRKMMGVMAAPLLRTEILSCAMAEDGPVLHGEAGVDRVVVLPGKTYLRGWAGYGDAPRPIREPWGPKPAAKPPVAVGPAPVVEWTKVSGPGSVKFADAKAMVTTATFSAPGAYVLRLGATAGELKAASTVQVQVEAAPPERQLDAVYTKHFQIDSPLWNARAKALIVNWIPHCIDQINRTDLEVGPGGIDNFVEAGKALRGEPHGMHKGYVFSNAWVHQTVEAMSLALMIDPRGDAEIVRAQEKMRATLEDWIPKILGGQEPDGYLQTAFTLDRDERKKVVQSSKFKHWDPAHRGDHEGYVAGYFLESAINHYLMTGKKDARLYNAAKKLADCWCRNLGPAPKKPWYDGHQQMEQGLVRFGRFVNDMEGGGKGRPYIELAKYLLDARYLAAESDRARTEYDQSHVPVVQQYEAVGHAVRAMYTYSGMADVAVETHDPDYQSAVKSLWDNLVNRKYYVTGGVGSGETSEGFGPNYSLRNRGYCEACSSCGAIFFHWKMNLAYHDAKYVDLYEDTMYNALLGSTDLDGKYFYYDNPLDESVPRYEWHVCPCCVGNIPRTLLMLPTWVYAKSPSGVNVNLFVGSSITVEDVGGTDVEMVQKTEYPWKEQVSITVNPKVSKRFSVRIRVPDRQVSTLYRNMPEVKGLTSLSVNGAAVKPVIEKGYAVITRTWKAGDRIELSVPLRPQLIHASEKVEATRGKVAFRYGPLIYNIEQMDQDIQKSFSTQAPLRAQWRPDLLGGVMVLEGKFTDGSPLLAIPHYARMNRVPGVALPPKDADRKALSIVWVKQG
jgi:DUF1680 family protein